MDKPASLSTPDPEGTGLDRLLFGRILALAATVAAADPARPIGHALGLGRDPLARLIARHAPDRTHLLDGAADDPGEEAIEEADLRALLLDYRAGRGEEEEWLAAIVARRSLDRNHLWQDMGFADRLELNAMFRRHFPSLADLNSGDMKWKKFFYRQLCEREGMLLCKSPNCEICDDVETCFGEEAGDPLTTLARLARGG